MQQKGSRTEDRNLQHLLVPFPLEQLANQVRLLYTDPVQNKVVFMKKVFQNKNRVDQPVITYM